MNRYVGTPTSDKKPEERIKEGWLQNKLHQLGKKGSTSEV